MTNRAAEIAEITLETEIEAPPERVWTALTEDIGKWWPGDAATASQCVLRSLEAIGHVDRNAHTATLLDGWLDELTRIRQRI